MFLVSRPTGRLRPQESRSYVRPFVRSYVTLFLKNRSSDFSEILYEVRVQKVRKNVPSAFLIIFTILAILAKNCPKWAFLAQNDKKWRFFAFFSRTTHQIFLIFCSKHSLWSRKKMTFSLFLGNFKNAPFWPKLTQIWPKFGLFWPDARAFDIFSSKILKKKNLNFFDFFFLKFEKNVFRVKKIHFFHNDHPYDSPFPTLRQILKFLKWRVFAFFGKIISFYIILVEIWLVQFKLNFFVFCHTQIGQILTKNGQKYVILGLKWLKIGFIELLSPNYVLIVPNFVFKVISQYS